MKIVVLEHFTSSPAALETTAIRAEGRAMRDAVVEDLEAIPGIDAILIDDAGPTHAARERRFRAALRKADAGLVIAPESDGLLERLAGIVLSEGRLLLGPAPGFTRLAGDKLRTARLLRAAGVRTPPTEAIPFSEARGRLDGRRRPFVLKPRDGCGSQGVVVVFPDDRIDAALRVVRKATRRRDFLAQEFEPGLPVSAAVIVASGRCLPLALSLQHLEPGRHPAYRGGRSPWRDPGAVAAIALACRAIRALDPVGERARGYIGVDLVLGAAGASVIEINPRLTTSYLGLRRVSRVNPARLILAAAFGRALPRRVPLRGVCSFHADGTIETRAGGARPRRERRPRSPACDFSVGTSAASI